MLALRRGLTGLATHTTARVMTSVRYASTFRVQDDHALEVREKPESLSYFTGNYKYNDLLIELDALYKQFARTAIGKKSDQMYSWKLRDKMSEALAIPLKTSQWRKIVAHLNSLTSLPHPLPAPILEAIEPYRRADLDQREHATKVKTLDDMGRALGVGRRKESSARCYVVEGDGQVLINGTPLHEYFKRPIDQAEVTLPLQVTENTDKYNIWALVEGGGNTGQAQAIKLGVARALLVHNADWKPTLRQAGCITRDPRVVERKKEGQRKARAKYTWVKR
ncbi:ribosomal protein S9/S16-domain-containing protein [Syncephalastrum racemosum]|uniref:Small ribosomal subunit protein uS9m n=1 Tax=Syncephalastrum racemosum TaxID=13706 RepID=A0A1X2HVF2_SYNRA|nr:ribosomal protein S9/S16-domain-containing protein [Syncephalastrum racemosum]